MARHLRDRDFIYEKSILALVLLMIGVLLLSLGCSRGESDMTGGGKTNHSYYSNAVLLAVNETEKTAIVEVDEYTDGIQRPETKVTVDVQTLEQGYLAWFFESSELNDQVKIGYLYGAMPGDDGVLKVTSISLSKYPDKELEMLERRLQANRERNNEIGILENRQ